MSKTLEKTKIDTMFEKARKAMEEIENYTQEETDRMVYSVGKMIIDHSEELAEMSFNETKMGSSEEQKAIIEGFVTGVWNHLSDKKSVGEIARDEVSGIVKVAHPGGVVANVTPVTTAVIGPVNNGMLALKGRNAVIACPPPSTKETSARAVELMREALEMIDAPVDLVQIVADPSIEASAEVMEKADIVIGTGGPGIVKAAYSSGTPAYGVGAGNGQLVLDEADDLQKFVEETIPSRLINSATSCNNAQTLHYPMEIETELRELFEQAGTYWVDDEETIEKIREAGFDAEGRARREVSGRSVDFLAEEAGITLPEGTVLIVTQTSKIGDDEILNKEKPFPVLNVRPYDSFEEALKASRANLDISGEGHSSSIYSNDEENIKRATEEMKVSRLLVNQPVSDSTFGSNNTMIPTVSQGCGFWGGNSTNDLLDYHHLLNIQRLVYRRERKATPKDIWDKAII